MTEPRPGKRPTVAYLMTEADRLRPTLTTEQAASMDRVLEKATASLEAQAQPVAKGRMRL